MMTGPVDSKYVKKMPHHICCCMVLLPNNTSANSKQGRRSAGAEQLQTAGASKLLLSFCLLRHLLAASHICLGWFAPAWYLLFFTYLPRPASTISPLPPSPDLQHSRHAPSTAAQHVAPHHRLLVSELHLHLSCPRNATGGGYVCCSEWSSVPPLCSDVHCSYPKTHHSACYWCWCSAMMTHSPHGKHSVFHAARTVCQLPWTNWSSHYSQ